MGRRTAAAEKRQDKARRVKQMHAKPYYPAMMSLDDLRQREAEIVQTKLFKPLTITLADEIELEPRTMRGQLRAKLRVLAYATWWTGLVASVIGIPWGGIRCVLAGASCGLVLVLLHRAMPRR